MVSEPITAHNFMFQLKYLICYSNYEGANKEHTAAATEANCGIGAHYFEITP